MVQEEKAEVSLIDARKAAERMAELKSQWVANMSHELRTPSNGILGMLDLLMDTPLNAEQKDYVATMRRSTNVLLTVISDILDFRRNETRQVKLQIEPFSVHGVMEDVCEILFPLAAQKNVDLVHVVSPDVPRMLMGDAARLRQVLVNLINNSIKFSNDGGGHVEVTCQLTTIEPEDASMTPASESTIPSSSTSPMSTPESSPLPSPAHSPSFGQKISTTPVMGPKRRPSAIFTTPLATSPPTILSATVTSPNLSLRSSRISPPPPTSPPTVPPRRPSFASAPTTPQPPSGAVCLKFSVSDSGVGIPKEQQAMLFEPFFQVDSSATRKHGGTGLGLAISRQIVTALGGKIWVQSEEGSGSTFSFTSQFSLPPLFSTPSATPITTSPPLRATPASPSLRSGISPHSRFFSRPSSASQLEPLTSSNVLPQQVVMFSDRKGAVMRVAQGILAQLIPAPPAPAPSPLILLDHASELPLRLPEIISSTILAPSSSLQTPYVACVLEISDVNSINAVLASLAPFLSREDCICRVVLITIPHLRSQITLPPSSHPLPSVVFLMKPLSESKLRTSLSLPPSTPIVTSAHNSPRAPHRASSAPPPLSSMTSSNSPSFHPISFHTTSSHPAALHPTSVHPEYSIPSALLSSQLPSIPQSPDPEPSVAASITNRSSTPPSISLTASTADPLPSSSSSSSTSSLVPSRSTSSLAPLSPSLPKSFSSDFINISIAPTAQRTPPPLRLSMSTDDSREPREPRIRRALCAEDNVVNQKVITWHLKKLGFSVVDIANDGAEAVEIVSAHPIGYYEFILMDLQMPVMDGFVATKLIREREAAQGISPAIIASLPIIAITANVMPGVQQRCSDAGMDGYVSKPVQAPQLVQVLKDLAILI